MGAEAGQAEGKGVIGYKSPEAKHPAQRIRLRQQLLPSGIKPPPEGTLEWTETSQGFSQPIAFRGPVEFVERNNGMRRWGSKQ